MPDSSNSFRPDAELDQLLRADRAISRRRRRRGFTRAPATGGKSPISAAAGDY